MVQGDSYGDRLWPQFVINRQPICHKNQILRSVLLYCDRIIEKKIHVSAAQIPAKMLPEKKALIKVPIPTIQPITMT